MKRMIALLCAVAMLVTFVACGAGKDDVTTTTAATADANTSETTTAATEPAETDPPKAFDSVPEQNLGGTFNIRYADADACYKDFDAKEQIGDVQNDAVYLRNTMVEEKLGIDIEISWATHATVNNDCTTQVNSGDHTYDLFGGHRDSLPLSYKGMHYDLKSIAALNLEEEWWDQGYVEAITINDSLYTVIGDIGISSLLFVSSLVFNKDLMDQNNIEYPYELVRAGKWTLDEYSKIIVNFGSDLNGDGQVSRKDDMFSVVGWSWESCFSNLYATGFSFVTEDANGVKGINYDADRLTSIMEKIMPIWTHKYSFNNFASGSAEHAETYGIFAQGRSLFADIILSMVGTFYSGMEQDFGIVPLPKYDESQETYKTYLGYTIPVLFLANNTPDPERTGTIMEALCTASYDEVTPKMYEIVTKLKNTRDEDSSEMIEIIIRNKHIDTAHFYNLTGYGNFSKNMINSGVVNVASTTKTYDRVAAKEWEKIVNAFDKLK